MATLEHRLHAISAFAIVPYVRRVLASLSARRLVQPQSADDGRVVSTPADPLTGERVNAITAVATIIVGLDGSPAARSALRVARRLVERGDARLILTGVRGHLPPFAAPALPVVGRVTQPMVSRDEHECLRAALQRYGDELALSASRVRAEVRVPDEQIKSIVCGVVDSAESTLAGVTAGRLARDLGCTLVLVHVLAPGDQVAHAEALLANAADMLDAPGEVRRVVRSGAAAAELAAVADEQGAVVIAVGPRGRGAVRAALLGSISRAVLSCGRYALLAPPPAAVDRLLAKERSLT